MSFLTFVSEEERRMTHRKRVLTVLNGGVPDKVARGDIMFHPKIIDEALGIEIKSDYGNALAAWMYEDMSPEEFQKQKAFRDLIGCDLIAVFPTFSLSEEGTERGVKITKDVFGNRIKVFENETLIERVIKTPADMDRYEYPDVKEFRYNNIALWSVKSDLCVLPITDSANFGIWFNLTGFENYMVWFYTERERLLRLMNRHIEFNVELAKECFKHGGDVVWIGDDFASNLGTFINPRDMKEFYFPLLKRQVRELKRSIGAPVVLHSDGDLGDVMEMIIESGLDAVMALQPFCGMDIRQLKHDYGSRITLWGNINISDLLIFRSPADVRAVVKETIGIAAPGGRFILSTSNSPAIPDIPTENILAMYETAEEYGEYPIEYAVKTDNYRKYIKKWR
jgi:uroporphyrinogen decarboxylase